jgi:hypothetical protein
VKVCCFHAHLDNEKTKERTKTMSIWKRFFGDRSKSQAPASEKPTRSAPPSRGLSERDNVGTRYESQEKVETWWTPYILSRPKFPFIFYDMREKKDAMDAMLSLPSIKIASDSGKLISTEVLQFGVYPLVVNGQTTSWGFFLAGDQISPALYEAAITSCKKYNGTNPRVSDPPKGSTTVTSSSTKPATTAVTFDWEEKVDMLAQMKARGIEIVGMGAMPAQIAIKRHYKGPSKEAALAFLKATPVDKPFFYVVVHTSDGVFCRDKDGIYEQPD